jgi:hypothetical protein
VRASKLGALFVLVTAGVGTFGAPADAHICPVTAVIPVGRPATITVAATVEGVPVPDVEIDVPAQLRLERVDRLPGWTVDRRGQTARFHGPPITPYTCMYFSIGVTARAKGAYAMSVFERDAEGRVVARSTLKGALSSHNPYAVQRVYAGVSPPSPGGGGGPSATAIAGVALIGLGVVGVGVLRVRSRRDRRRHEPKTDLDTTIEEFKRQARDRSRSSP